jgi:hypothetical protein
MPHKLTAQALHWKFPTHNLATSMNKITLFEPGPKPTEKEISKYVVEYEAYLKNTQYRKDRKKEYPRIEEQLDMQYHDLEEGTKTWQKAIAEVKKKYPKP